MNVLLMLLEECFWEHSCYLIIHNNSSSSEEVFWSESGEKSASDQAAFTSLNSSILMWETTADALFHWRKHYYGLWTHILVKNILMLDLFQLLSSPDVNWWTGVVWIIVMFLSDSHSDGTHSLQSIHCWDTDAETHFSKPDEETNSS